jgi:LacI family transcriptional regulator
LANIKDVAREAGVSVATVSRVFNDSGLVSEQTRRNVRTVAERLNYWPNGVARSLITNRTHTLGVLLPDLHGEFFSEIIRGIDLSARRAGLHLLLSSSHSDSDEVLAVVRSMRGRIEGLIVMAPDVDAHSVLQSGAAHFPLVLVDPAMGAQGCDTISIANYEGASAMVQHLIRLGHRRIATISGPSRNVDARQRLEGYRAALRNAGVDLAPELEVAGDFSEQSGYAAAAALLAIQPRPTAVFVANDYMAVGLLSALHAAGVRVPGDMAVAGFDDIALARYVNPPLTTVNVDAFHLGERAFQLMADLLARRGQSAERVHEVIEARLVVRSSCGAGGPHPMATGER